MYMHGTPLHMHTHCIHAMHMLLTDLTKFQENDLCICRVPRIGNRRSGGSHDSVTASRILLSQNTKPSLLWHISTHEVLPFKFTMLGNVVSLAHARCIAIVARQKTAVRAQLWAGKSANWLGATNTNHQVQHTVKEVHNHMMYRMAVGSGSCKA